jgi:hypothetical protein
MTALEDAPAPNIPQGHVGDAPVKGRDEAMGMVGEEEHPVDPIIAARALRKIDLFLIPAMIVGCK